MYEVIDKYLEILIAEKNLAKNTLISYRKDLDDFYLYIRQYNHQQYSVKLITNYIEFLAKKSLKNSSYIRKISSLRGFVQYILAEKLITENPLSHLNNIKEYRILPKYLSLAEINKLIFAYKKSDNIRDLLMIELLYATGIRVSELVTLKLANINFINIKTFEFEDFIVIYGKGRKERLVPVSKIVKIQLKDYLQKYQEILLQNNNKWLFPANSKLGHITRQFFAKRLKYHALIAKIDPDRVSPHIIRHSFATHLLDNGLDLRSIQELLGHENLSTTEIYTHISTKKLKNTVAQFHPLELDKFKKI